MYDSSSFSTGYGIEKLFDGGGPTATPEPGQFPISTPYPISPTQQQDLYLQSTATTAIPQSYPVEAQGGIPEYCIPLGLGIAILVGFAALYLRGGRKSNP